MALGGIAILLLHRKAQRTLALTSPPGTLAAAVAITGKTDLAHMIDGTDTEADMRVMLADLKFGIDTVSFGCFFFLFLFLETITLTDG